MNEKLRKQLLEMENIDRRVRQKLVDDGQLFAKQHHYHPKMKKVHETNNKLIRKIINKYGWPGFSLVGNDGCEAAGFIIQHAVLDPELQERCLDLLARAVKQNDAYPWMYALLRDRVLVHQGKLQIYGSQHYIDEKGKSVPYPIEDPMHMEERRKEVGLEPLAQRTAEIQEEWDNSTK